MPLRACQENATQNRLKITHNLLKMNVLRRVETIFSHRRAWPILTNLLKNAIFPVISEQIIEEKKLKNIVYFKLSLLK